MVPHGPNSGEVEMGVGEGVGSGGGFLELAGQLAWVKGISGFSEPLQALRLVQS